MQLHLFDAGSLVDAETAASTRTRPYAGLGAVWGLGAVTALLLVLPIWSALLRVGLDYNEGWNAVIAQRWMAGEPLYPPFDALSANNYPPLSFFFAGWLGAVLGDTLFAGRLLAFIGLLTAAFATGAIVGMATGRPRAALLTGLLLVGYDAALYPNYVGMDDPQWQGHGIMTLGLLAFVASRRRTGRFATGLLVVSAGLMVAGGFVKHLLLPIPLAATVWIALHRREALARWIALCLVFLLAALALCAGAFGQAFLQGVFHDARGWSLDRCIYKASTQFITVLPLLLLASFALPAIDRLPEGKVAGYYALASIAVAIVACGGKGVDRNAVFDLVIALSLIIGLAIGQFQAAGAGAAGQAAGLPPGGGDAARWSWLLVVVVGLYVPTSLRALQDLRQSADRSREEAAETVAYLARQPGPVACEDLSLCYWAGKGFEIDFFVLGRKLDRGLVAPDLLLERLKTHYYSAIQTMAVDGNSFRLPADVNSRIAEYYRLARTGAGGAVLVPKSP